METSTNNCKWSDDIFTTLTLEECEKVFADCDKNPDQFIETKDKLSLLRSCVELLNRLESTTNNAFAGKVLIFLARAIPLFDQSGLNLRSEFNVKEIPKTVSDNLLNIDSQIAENTKKLIAADMEEGEMISDDENNICTSIDDSAKIYQKFWSIQQLLNQPNNLYDRAAWFNFRTGVDYLVSKIENKPSNLRVWKMRSSYMTDLKSLSLQLNDINMRRCFLLQIIIVLQYLELPVDTRPDSFVPDKAQLSWSSAIIRRIYGILEVTPNQEEGRKFYGLVRFILRREEMWNRWKNEKCKEPMKPSDSEEIVNMRGTYHKRRKMSDELRSAKAYDLHVIGSSDMTRLWNTKQILKLEIPEISQYLSIPQEKQSDCFKDPNYSFRVLRLMRRSPYFFGPSSAAISSIDGYLKQAALRYVSSSTKSGNSIKMEPQMNDSPTKNNQKRKDSQDQEMSPVDNENSFAKPDDLPLPINQNGPTGVENGQHSSSTEVQQ